MKSVLLVLLMIIALDSRSQTVTINGTAKTSFNNDIKVSIEVNDTSSKAFGRYFYNKGTDAEKKQYELIYHQVRTNPNLVLETDNQGKFSINVRLTDTLFFSGPGEITQKHAVKDLHKLKTIFIQLKREPCEEYIPCKDTVASKFYVFIGEKLSVNSVKRINYCETIILDMQYKATYRIVKNILGGYLKDTITFMAYDHYGTPAFSNYKYVMLFVSEFCGKLYHEKYQFFDVYLTKDNQWASPGGLYRFLKQQKERNVRARPITFPDSVYFKPKQFDYPYGIIERKEPDFKIVGDKAYPIMGLYIDDMLKVKKEGTLKGTGYFK